MSKMVAVKELSPGDVLADAVCSVVGKVLLGKDVVLTQRHISLLNVWDVQSVFINVEEGEEVLQPETPDEELNEKQDAPPANAQDKTSNVQSQEYVQFVEKYDSIITNTVQSFNLIHKRKIVPASYLKDIAGEIHTSITEHSFEILNYLLVSDCKLADFISRHSVMVAYFSGIIARQMHWSEADVTGVTFASLLHDVGNLATDKVEDSRKQAHIAETAGLLKEVKGLPNEVILGVVQHREPINGNTLSIGTKACSIHPYAKIIAIADTFHNLAYTDEYANPFPTLDMFTREMYGRFDADMCQTFINRVKDSLLLNKIVLSSGQEAEVIFFNRGSYAIPVVRTTDNEIIDLSERKDLAIKQIVTLAYSG